MGKSLLYIVHPRPKYNFSAYRKESYKHLQFLLDRLREKAQHLCEESVTSGEDEKGCPFVTFQSEEVFADIQRYDSEIKYLERLIRICSQKLQSMLNMAREERNIIGYTIALVSEFANRFGVEPRQAYAYIKRYKGLEHLQKHYAILHTQSFPAMSIRFCEMN